MIEDGVGGGNTITGLHFEKKVDLIEKLKSIPGYTVKEKTEKKLRKIYDIFFKDEWVAEFCKGEPLYKYLEHKGVKNPKTILSKKLRPDGALIVIVRETLFIIEIKYQQVAGSVDEKLQTCDFKRKQYQKLVKSIGLKVEYVYVLNDWFKDPKYKDVLDYIHSVNCHYKFKEIPLAWLGLPQGVSK